MCVVFQIQLFLDVLGSAVMPFGVHFCFNPEVWLQYFAAQFEPCPTATEPYGSYHTANRDDDVLNGGQYSHFHFSLFWM